MWKTAINNTRAVFAVLRKELKEALSEDDIKNINETEMVVIMALKKLIPKKPISTGIDHELADLYVGLCPICRWGINSAKSFCDNCGQAIDWGE